MSFRTAVPERELRCALRCGEPGATTAAAGVAPNATGELIRSVTPARDNKGDCAAASDRPAAACVAATIAGIDERPLEGDSNAAAVIWIGSALPSRGRRLAVALSSGSNANEMAEVPRASASPSLLSAEDATASPHDEEATGSMMLWTSGESNCKAFTLTVEESLSNEIDAAGLAAMSCATATAAWVGAPVAAVAATSAATLAGCALEKSSGNAAKQLHRARHGKARQGKADKFDQTDEHD